MFKAPARKATIALLTLCSTFLGISQIARADVTLGAILPLTGASASIGEDQRRGIELAVHQINAKGGVNGQKLEVMIEDSAGNPITGLDAVRKLTQINHVPLVVGAFSSGVTIPIGQYLVKHKLVHINISGTSTDIRRIGNYSYSVIGLDDLSAEFAAKDVYGQGYRRVAFIAPNGAYGQGMARQFSRFFQKLGGTVISQVLYTGGQASYRGELEQLTRSKPDVYVYTSYGQDAIVLNRNAYQLGLHKKPWYGIYLAMCTAKSPATYTQGQMGLEVASLGVQGKHYVTDYRQRYHQAPLSAYGSYAYDSIMLAAKAIDTAKSTAPADIQKAMLKVAPHFSGVTGPLNLDADHLRQSQPYRKVKITNGELTSR
ncbi:ABC transporter substrate-binding protein [Celerinatantimonas yamalensis]|uniref:ABC transporter substrate-binding protein n=1 Tax=Celerinatantimonas yamalensis TaxID=559956 RepID=A0ABW9G9E5_9GAMM